MVHANGYMRVFHSIDIQLKYMNFNWIAGGREGNCSIVFMIATSSTAIVTYKIENTEF